MKKYIKLNRISARLQVIVLATLLLIPAAAMGAQVYIPHITGTGGVWHDYLQVDNPTQMEAFFTVTIYDNGADVFTQTFPVEALGETVIDLKTLPATFNSGTGIVQWEDQYQLNARLSYENKSGGGGCGVSPGQFRRQPHRFLFQRLHARGRPGRPSPSPTGGDPPKKLPCLPWATAASWESKKSLFGKAVRWWVPTTEWFPTVDERRHHKDHCRF